MSDHPLPAAEPADQEIPVTVVVLGRSYEVGRISHPSQLPELLREVGALAAIELGAGEA